MIAILEQPQAATHVQYSAPHEEEVTRFLTVHPEVTQVLREATKPLEDAFGKDAQVSLVVTSNPEIAAGEFLVSSIQTSLSAAQAATRLHAFDETWWFENAPRVEGQLLFTITFR